MLSARLRAPICRALTIRTPLYPAQFKVTPALQPVRPTVRIHRDLHAPLTAAMTADRSRSASPDGSAEWPCRAADLKAGQQFLQKAVDAGGRIVLAPDKDADGLSAGAHRASAGSQQQHSQADGRHRGAFTVAHRNCGLLVLTCSWALTITAEAQARSCSLLCSSWGPRTSSRTSYPRWVHAAAAYSKGTSFAPHPRQRCTGGGFMTYTRSTTPSGAWLTFSLHSCGGHAIAEHTCRAQTSIRRQCSMSCAAWSPPR